jgi:hypothetical protein
MRIPVTVLIALVTACTTPLWAEVVTPQRMVEFSPASGSAGQWHYDGVGILSFDQGIRVDSALGSNSDGLTGARVILPTFQIGAIPEGPYSLRPLGNAQITIRNADNGTIYLTGTLGTGDLATFGTVAGGFTQFQADITNLLITHEGAALGSAALAVLSNMRQPSLDFELSLHGGSGPGYLSFAGMLDGSHCGRGGFSGAMSVPEPTTVALLGLGGLALIRRRRTQP